MHVLKKKQKNKQIIFGGVPACSLSAFTTTLHFIGGALKCETVSQQAPTKKVFLVFQFLLVSSSMLRSVAPSADEKHALH